MPRYDVSDSGNANNKENPMIKKVFSEKSGSNEEKSGCSCPSCSCGCSCECACDCDIQMQQPAQALSGSASSSFNKATEATSSFASNLKPVGYW